MGIWSFTLFSNDITCDVRDSYMKYLEQQLSDEEAYKNVCEEYNELIGTDEEPLFWYALADTQWKMGRLSSEVKYIVLSLINDNAGFMGSDNDTKEKIQWKNTLGKLKSRIESDMPPKKAIPRCKDFVRNPWNIGDIYAYEFHTKKADENGLFGKYVLFQKVADAKYYDGSVFSVVQIFDYVFNNVPQLHQLNSIRILPLCFPSNVVDGFTDKSSYIPSFECYQKATMIYEKECKYPKKHFTFVGNQIIQKNEYEYNPASDFYLEKNGMEDWLVDYYISWHSIGY